MRGSIQDLATLFEVSLDMLCIRDMDLKFVRVNRAWEEVLGYPITELEGAPMLRFVHPDDIGDTNGRMDLIVAEDEVRGFINRYRHRDGHYRFLEWRARRVGDLVFGVARDVTERLAAEEKIRAATVAAEAANRAKSEFLANMSHEIRTPLNGVIGLVDALSRTALAEPQREMVDLIQRSGATLERLVSDILDVSKIEAGQLDIETRDFDLRHELGGVFDLNRLKALQKGLAFQVEIGEQARGDFQGDSGRIKQVLGNLLSNAVKFTHQGGVRARIDVIDPDTPDQPSTFLFEVKDTGVGFGPEFAGSLFTRFAQADGTITRRFGGSGLGLSICKSLVEMMGGEITAESAAGRGSVFRVILPLPRTPAVSDARPPKASAPDQAAEAGLPARESDDELRILLAEDHPINQKVIQLMLAPQGARVLTVGNGAEAVAALAAQPFDLILMDMQMPVMDGLTATRAIRRGEALAGAAQIPIIVLSANAMAQHRQDALDAGADMHIAKPVTMAALICGIEQVLASRREAKSALGNAA